MVSESACARPGKVIGQAYDNQLAYSTASCSVTYCFIGRTYSGAACTLTTL